jgi:uncharacterized membrane protein
MENAENLGDFLQAFLLTTEGGTLFFLALSIGIIIKKISKNFQVENKINAFIPLVNMAICGFISANVPYFYANSTISEAAIWGILVAAFASFCYDKTRELKK